MEIEQLENISEYSNDVKIKLQLEIYPPNRPAYRVETIENIPFIKTPQIQPDSILQVRISPIKPQKIEIKLR